MLIIPKDYPSNRYHLLKNGDSTTMTYQHEDKSRLQITRDNTTFECFWTPRQYFGDCLSRLHRFGFLAFKESSFNAEFSDGRKIATQNWQPALEHVSECPDEDLRNVEFSGSNGRSMHVSSISGDHQLDFGLRAEVELIVAFKSALLLTSAPRTVKVAWNRMTQELFPNKFGALYFRINPT